MPRPVSRVYGVLSMVFGALMMVVVLVAVTVDRISATPLYQGLSGPQAGLASTTAERDPRQQLLSSSLNVVYGSTSVALFALGIGQLRRWRMALRLTPIWAVGALICLCGAIAAEIALGSKDFTSAVTELLLFGPYPVVLLTVFTRARTGAHPQGTPRP